MKVISAPASFAFVALIAFGIFPPYATIVGPLSFDDLLPLIALGLGVLLMKRAGHVPSLNEGVLALGLLAGFGAISSTANAETFPELLRYLARSTGRTLCFAMIASMVPPIVGARWPRACFVVAIAAALEASFSVFAWLIDLRGPWGFGVIDFNKNSRLYGLSRAQGTFAGETQIFELESHSANFLGAYLAMSVLVTLALAIHHRRDRRGLMCFALTTVELAALYLTYTRAALIALMIGLFCLGSFMGRQRLAIALALGFVAISASIPSVRDKFYEGHNRFALYSASASIVADHPLFGIGDGRFDEVLRSDRGYMQTPYGRASTAAHNSVLLSAVHHGLLGGVAHLLVYVLAALIVRRALMSVAVEERIVVAGLAAALVAFLVQDQFNNLFQVPKVATQVWLIFGLLASSSPPKKEGPSWQSIWHAAKGQQR